MGTEYMMYPLPLSVVPLPWWHFWKPKSRRFVCRVPERFVSGHIERLTVFPDDCLLTSWLVDGEEQILKPIRWSFGFAAFGIRINVKLKGGQRVELRFACPAPESVLFLLKGDIDGG